MRDIFLNKKYIQARQFVNSCPRKYTLQKNGKYIIACEERLVHELAHGDISEPCYLVSSDLVCLMVCFHTHSSQCFLYLHILGTKEITQLFANYYMSQFCKASILVAE
jgi:hypothetical protein